MGQMRRNIEVNVQQFLCDLEYSEYMRELEERRRQRPTGPDYKRVDRILADRPDWSAIK